MALSEQEKQEVLELIKSSTINTYGTKNTAQLDKYLSVDLEDYILIFNKKKKRLERIKLGTFFNLSDGDLSLGNFKGSFDTEEALTTAIPTGAEEDFAFVGTSIYIWSVDELTWKLSSGNSSGGGALEEEITVLGWSNDGGIKNNDVFPIGTTSTFLWKKLLTTEIPPVYVQPTVTTAINISTLQKIGVAVAPILTITSAKNDAGDFSNLRYYKQSLEINQVDVPSQTNNSFTVPSFSIIAGANTFKAHMDYAQGPIKNTNLSNPYPLGRIEAGEKISNTVTVTGIYPFYYGVNAADLIADGSGIITGLTELLQTQGTKNLNYSGTNVYLYFAYDANYPDLSSIKDPNGFAAIGTFTKHIVNVTSVGLGTNWTKSYKVYKNNNGLASPSGVFQFIF